MELIGQQLLNGITVGSLYAVVALGFALVFSVMGVLNMTHPELVMVGAYAAFVVSDLLVDNVVVILILSLVAGLLLGLVIERLVIRPTRGMHFLTPFVATLGIAIALQYAAQLIFGVDPVRISVEPKGVLNFGGIFITPMQLLVMVLSFLMLFAVRYYVLETRWGRASRAVAEDHVVAAGLGINVNRVSQLTVGLSAALAGVAGAGVALSQGYAFPFLGATYGTKAFVAMLVAGNKRIEGVIAVALGLGIVEAFVAGFVSAQLRDAIAYGLMILILLVKPNGLFGSYDRA